MTRKFGRFLRQNTIALLALFIALGGTTFAASTIVLPKNSVGTKQLKKNAVTSVKIKNNQVTGADVRESSLGKVPSAANADNATSATSATSATTAATAANANLLQGNAASVFATRAQEAVHLVGTSGNPPFQNSWSNFGGGFSSTGFWKDSFGVVHLQGTFSGGAAGTAAFTLPVGYRPPQALFMTVATGATSLAFVYILTTGEVAPQNSGGDDGIDGLSFRAAGSSASADAHGPVGHPGR
jgi:hypothetical protein